MCGGAASVTDDDQTHLASLPGHRVRGNSQQSTGAVSEGPAVLPGCGDEVESRP